MQRKIAVILGTVLFTLGIVISLIHREPDTRVYRDETLLVRHVRVLEDEKIAEYPVDILIEGGTIAEISRSPIVVPPSTPTIEASGLVATPGFIDVNSCGPVLGAAGLVKVFDGVTTVLAAQGESLSNLKQASQWRSILNYASSIGFVGLQNLSSFDELVSYVDNGFREGAYAISFSPEYQHLQTKEVIKELCRRTATKNRLVTFHTRYSDPEHELEGVQEALDCGDVTTPVQLLHLHSTGGTYHPNEAREMIERARRSGKTIIRDFYPFTTWASPARASRFAPGFRSRFPNLKRVFLPGSVHGVSDRELESIRGRNNRQLVVVESIPQETVAFFLRDSETLFASGSAIITDRDSHPRVAATFTTALADAFKRGGELEFARIAYRASTKAAAQLSPFLPGLQQRGVIKAGAMADLVVWDLRTLRVNATYLEPSLPSQGVRFAVINGKLIIANGHSKLPITFGGRFLKGSGE